jgi:transcriptional regulator with XRE-family HTH domain
MADEVYARIGAAIRARRDGADLTQASLAEMTGLKRTSITNIESGGQAITLVQLMDVARALGTDAAQLIKEAEGLRLTSPSAPANNPLASELLSQMVRPTRSASL